MFQKLRGKDQLLCHSLVIFCYINRNALVECRSFKKKDQLLQEAEKGEVFNGYYEGTLTFKPTYKYDIGSSIYDTSHKVS